MYDVVIVDGNNFAKRALHSHENLSVKKEAGKIGTGLIFGFYEILITMLEKFEGNPKIIVAWDKGRKKRTAIYPGYKGGRDKAEKDPKKQKKKEAMRVEFNKQMVMIAPVLRANGIYQAYVPGEEADDVIGTLARNYSRKGYKVLIASGDHDMLQLINKNTDLYLARPSKSEFWDVSKFEKTYRLKPQQMIDVMSLEGDTTDSIPGVKGIGEAKALRVIQHNPNFVQDVLLDKIDSEAVIANVSKKEAEMLMKGLDDIRMAYKLVRIDCEMDGLKIVKPKKDLERLWNIFDFLEFNSYMNKAKWKIFVKIGDDKDVEC